MRSPNRSRPTVPIAPLVLLLVAGHALVACGDGDAGGPAGTTVGEPGAPSTLTTELVIGGADTDTDTDGGGGEGAGGDPAGDEPAEVLDQPARAGLEPVASADLDSVTVNGDPIVIRVEVLGLDRAGGDTLHLQFSLTNLGEVPFEIWNFFSEGYEAFDVSGVSLVDLAGNLRYLVLADSDGTCVCTSFSHSIALAPGDVLVLDASFPAPPAGVDHLDLQIPMLGLVPAVPVAG